MFRFITSGNYGALAFPSKATIDSATALTDTTDTYVLSVFKTGTHARLLRVTRLDGGTTADVITIIDPAAASTGIVLTRTGTAAGPVQVWDFGPKGLEFNGGFGVKISSGGTAGLYVYQFDYTPSIV